MNKDLGLDPRPGVENEFDLAAVDCDATPVVQVDAQPPELVIADTVSGVEVARVQAETQAKIFLARKFPRNREKARRNILNAAKVYHFAEKARYSFPRGRGNTVIGISIRGVEEIGRQWRNLDSGTQVLSMDMEKSISLVSAFCWDLESNYKDEKRFPVEHYLDLKGGKKKHLTDHRDVYEYVQNQAQRRKRACILTHIPYDLQLAFLEECRQAIAKGPSGLSMQQYVDMMVDQFAAVSVSAEMLEGRLCHKLSDTSREEMVELRDIYNAIKDDPRLRAKHFDLTNGTEVAKVMGVLDANE